MVFVSGPELMLDSVEVGVETGGLGQEVAVALGVQFGGSGFYEGETGPCFSFFASGSVFGSD